MRHLDGYWETGYCWEQYGHWEDMLFHLTTPKCPDGLENDGFLDLKKNSAFFYVHNNFLMRRSLPVSQISVGAWMLRFPLWPGC